VKNLGYVQVVWEGPARVRLCVHPDRLEPGALGSLKMRRDTFGDAEVELVWLSNAWQSEIFPDAAGAIGRIDLLVEADAAPREQYRATRQDLAELDGRESHPLRLMLQKWRISFHRFSETVFPFAMQHGLFSRLAIVGVKRTDPDPVFRFMGDGFSVLYGEEFVANAPGQLVENQPDKAYARWIRDTYRDVGLSKEPRFELIEAVVPQALRGPFLRYERLLLPWETPSGEVLVTLYSQMIACSTPANDAGPATPARAPAAPPPQASAPVPLSTT
jgi:hypothetical protein